MTIDEIKKDSAQKYNRMLDLGLKITEDYISARRLDTEQLRNLLVQISVVAFASVGFSIPIIGTSTELNNTPLFLYGLLLLIITAVGGLWYSAVIIENSIKNSSEGFKTNRKELDEAISNQVFLMQNPNKYQEFVAKTKKFATTLKNKNSNIPDIKRDLILYLFLSLLTIGIFCIFFSILPLNGGSSDSNSKTLHHKKIYFNKHHKYKY